MRLRKVLGLAGLGIVLGVGGLIADALIGWRPRFGVEAELQRIITAAEMSDYYGNPGWDKQDVTGEVCTHVDVATLKKLGMSDKPTLRLGFDGRPTQPIYVWEMTQDKGILETCRTHTLRYLRISIDPQTLKCVAEVSVGPACDM